MPTLPATPALIGSIFQGFDTVFQTQYNDVQTQYEKLTMIVKSNGQSTIYPWLERSPGVRRLIGERKINDLQLKGYQIFNYPYEETDALPMLDIMTDQYDAFAQRVRIMANNVKVFPELKIFGELLMGGFSTTKADGSSNTCYDGQAFFGTHTRAGNQFTNALNTALTDENFEAALIQLYTQLGTPGTQGEAPLLVAPKVTLVCGPRKMQEAKRITKNEFKNFGASNENAGFVDLIVSTIITDNSWYLTASDAAMKPFIWQNLTEPEFVNLTDPSDENMFMRQKALFGTLWYCGWGYTLPELAVGSQGGN
jgi:phage major head subunit gpT-like protein